MKHLNELFVALAIAFVTIGFFWTCSQLDAKPSYTKSAFYSFNYESNGGGHVLAEQGSVIVTGLGMVRGNWIAPNVFIGAGAVYVFGEDSVTVSSETTTIVYK
jgi:hypothetical protein